MCFLRCLNDLLIRCRGTSHPDVVADRTAAQPRILQHHTKATPQRLALHIPDISTAYADGTRIDIVEPHQQIDQRCLSTAGRTDNCYHLAVFYIQIKILDQLFLRCVGERHMFQTDMAHVIFRQRFCRLRIRNLRFLIDQFKHPARTCNRILQLCDNTGNFIKWLRILIRIRQKCRELSDSHHPAYCRKRSGQADSCIDKAVDKPGCRIGDG